MLLTVPAEQFPTLFDITLLVLTAPAAVATTFGKALRQDVQTPATDEFSGRQRDVFGLIAAAVSCAFAGGERHDASVVTYKSSIRNRTAR